MAKFNEKLIFHIDVNSAFLSWTATDKLRRGDDIDLREIAAVIGGDEESRRGVVLAKSMIAKKFGIVTGESLFTARKKCGNLVVVSPDFKLYERCSKDMREIFGEYTPYIEKFSIDECFLDMTSYNTSRESALKLACDIRDRIKSELGFTVNIGISDVKLLSKMASDFEKPDKIQFVCWPNITGTLWEYSADYTQSFLNDSAVALYYNPTSISPNGTKTVSTYYGIGTLSSSGNTNNLNVSISAPQSLSVDSVNGNYSPNPFTITAYLKNESSTTVNNAAAKISLQAGTQLSLLTEETVYMQNISPNGEKTATWRVLASPQTDEKTLSYSIKVTSANTPNSPSENSHSLLFNTNAT